MDTSEHEIEDLLEAGESLTLEFKSDRKRLPDSDLVATIVSLANTEGGDLLLGVEDDGTVTGLHSNHLNVSGIPSLIANKTNPAISVRVERCDLQGKSVARITVPKSRQLVSTSDGLLVRRRLKLDGTPEAVPFYPHEFIQRQSSVMLRQLKQTASEAMSANANIKASWLHPSQHAASENNLRRSMISVRGISAFALVPPLAKRLFDDQATSGAGLRGSTRIDFKNPDTSAFSLVFQDLKKRVPTRVLNRTGKPVVPHHPPDVEPFHSDCAVAVDQSGRHLVMLITAGIGDPGVQLSYPRALFFSGVASPLFAAKAALLYPQCPQGFFERLNGGFLIAIGGSQKGFNTDIYSGSGFIGNIRNGYIRQPASGNNVPLISFSLDGNRFDFTVNLPMQIDAHSSNMLKPKLITHYPGPISNTGVGETIESISPFESRVAWLFSGFYAAKECTKRLIQAAHRGLGATKINAGKVGISRTLISKPCGLVGIFDRLLFGFVGHFSLLKASVIQAPVRLERNFQFSNLVGIGFKTELVGAKHLSSFLVFDIGANRLLGYVPNRSGVVAPTPKRRDSGAKRRKLLSQHSTAEPFKPVYDFSNTPARIKFDKQMNVIGHDFHCVDRHFQFVRFFVQKLLKSGRNLSGKYRTAVFRAPHDMKFKAKYSTSVFGVSIHANIINLTVSYFNTMTGGERFLCRLKSAGPALGCFMGLVDPSAMVLEGVEAGQLDPLQRLRIRNAIKKYGGEQSLLALADDELDGALGLCREMNGVRRPTIAGLLLLGTESLLRQHLPAYEVAFQVLQGTDVKVNEFFRKPLLETFEEVELLFRARVEEDEIQVGLFRVPVPNYDRRAFREAFVNALVHRDFSRLGAVHVKITDDGLSISNPGGFVEGVTLDNLLVADPRSRNPLLADVIKRIGLAERTGRGIDRIYEGMLRYGRPVPDYSMSDEFTVSVQMVNVVADLDFLKMVVEQEDKLGNMPIDSLIILSRLREERRLTTADLAPSVQKPEANVRATLEKLVETGFLEPHGTGRGRTYTLSAALYRKAGKKSEYIRQAGFAPIQQEQMVLNYIDKHGSIKRAEVMDLCHLDRNQAYRLLTRMKEAGQIKQIGELKGAVYERV